MFAVVEPVSGIVISGFNSFRACKPETVTFLQQYVFALICGSDLNFFLFSQNFDSDWFVPQKSYYQDVLKVQKQYFQGERAQNKPPANSGLRGL